MILMRSPLALASLFLGLIPGGAWAGDSVCWVENGVLLVPAVAAGVNGVFILDTGAAQSQLDATQASEVGIGESAATTSVRLAGGFYTNVRMQVLELDARTRSFPTPIAGVLGSDVLAGQVLTVEQNPCRLRLSRPGRPRDARGAIRLPVELSAGVPYVRAGVSDGTQSRAGAFRIDTGGPLAVNLAPSAAPLTPSDGRLRALSVGGVLFENVSAAPAPDAADAALGGIGEPIWARFSMRLDYVARTLTLLNSRPTQWGEGRVRGGSAIP